MFYTKGSLVTLLSFYLLFACRLSFAEPSLSSLEDLNSKIGQAIFEKLWVFAPSSTKSSDGLGPLYNARSCHQCHKPSRQDVNNFPSSLVIQLSIEPDSRTQTSVYELKKTGFIPEPVYGKQFQTFAYPGAKAEAEISVSYEKINIKFPDGENISLSKIGRAHV